MTFLDGSSYLIYLAAIAGLLHGSLQLPLATLLQLRGRWLGKNKPRQALASSIAVSLGAVSAISLLLVVAGLALSFVPQQSSRIVIAGVVTVYAGIFIALFYFKKAPGVQLWLPNAYTQLLQKNGERSATWPSAFRLGVAAVFFEAVLSLPLALAAVAILLSVDNITHAYVGLALYVAIASLPLVIALIKFAWGASTVTMQRWRSDNKLFWQVFAGVCFILYGVYLVSQQLLASGQNL